MMRGCVYIIRALTTEYYKIGITTDIEKRICGIQTAVPFWDLELVATQYSADYRVIEKMLHENYSSQRLRNSEWFIFTDDELKSAQIELIEIVDQAARARVREERRSVEAKHQTDPERVVWSKHSTTIHDLFPILSDREHEELTIVQVAEQEPAVQATEQEPVIHDQDWWAPRKRIAKLHDEEMMSWRQIAKLPRFDGIIAPGSLCSFAKGTWSPQSRSVRLALGLPIFELCEECAERLRSE